MKHLFLIGNDWSSDDISQIVSQTFNTWSEKLVHVALMVDLEKALDNIRIDGLLIQTYYLEIKDNFSGLLQNYLVERKTSFRIDGFQSEELKSTVGLLHGSVLSFFLKKTVSTICAAT